MLIHDLFLSSSVQSLYRDAAASLGYGAVYSLHWFYAELPPRCRYQNIALFELYPIVLAVNVWDHLWKKSLSSLLYG